MEEYKTLNGYDGVGSCVRERRLFRTRIRDIMNAGKGRHIFSHWHNNVYAVYSYGVHYPMYVYDKEAQVWLGNEEKSTKTTEKHKGLAKPPNVQQYVSTEKLKDIIGHGGVAAYYKELILAP